ncbi:MAG: hypothetical protein V3V15_00295 [Sphingorhabdus sp.]
MISALPFLLLAGSPQAVEAPAARPRPAARISINVSARIVAAERISFGGKAAQNSKQPASDRQIRNYGNIALVEFY